MIYIYIEIYISFNFSFGHGICNTIGNHNTIYLQNGNTQLQISNLASVTDPSACHRHTKTRAHTHPSLSHQSPVLQGQARQGQPSPNSCCFYSRVSLPIKSVHAFFSFSGCFLLVQKYCCNFLITALSS